MSDDDKKDGLSEEERQQIEEMEAAQQEGEGASADKSDGSSVEKAEFDHLNAGSGLGASGSEDVNLEMILDLNVNLAMEVGRTKISIRNLLQLSQGSVVELDRFAGEPLDVTVNGTLVAHGEVVVVNEKFGIRLTDVISPSERIKKLR
ncbi:flagellar motor switch protein FliN/FliY [Natronospira proteinivora]|uniref:Flagellar motor switch protein FliN n=1 Tax=Natronospira proteinivora TaxID=1807133 RepID=A0ABT1G573_9GAMM|nr:flagellar motor switch protein FliN [Natronospira proteinivora]MCP1726444.1 flagellar motor switch protein FliN/FliY [Natronospira proteinivora]